MLSLGRWTRSCAATSVSAGVRDKAQQKRKLLRVRERSMKVDCQPTTSAAEKRLQAAEEENVARKRHIAKQRKRALERLVEAKRQKK